MNWDLDDTIAAISTAPGRAGTALVRISGPRAAEIGEALGLGGLAPRHATLSTVTHPDGTVLDRAIVTSFPSPRSFTGEDVLEISSHGGLLVPNLILDAAIAAGARQALAGEFTRRALLNGRLDLVQVEATQDLIEAQTPASHAAAVSQLDGGLSRRVEEIRRSALELRALLAYDIDFPEEDDGPVPKTRIHDSVASLRDRLAELLANAPEGERLRDGALVVLAGAPNAGKSSVFNSLLGSQRAIVTETPGTTRDAIEADTSIEGFPFRFVDTAGVRDEAEAIEEIGIEVARRYLGRADVVLLCVEAGREWTSSDEDLIEEAVGGGASVLVLRTKTDLLGDDDGPPDSDGPDGREGLGVSAVTGAGLGRLREELVSASFAGLRATGEPALVTRARQARALEEALASLERFDLALRDGVPAEVADTDLADVANALEELIGVADVEDILGAIFESFCVGK